MNLDGKNVTGKVPLSDEPTKHGEKNVETRASPRHRRPASLPAFGHLSMRHC